MTSYYKLVRTEELLPQLKNNLLEDRKWQDHLRNKLQLCEYSVTTGYGNDRKTMPFSDMPPLFILKDISFHFQGGTATTALIIAAAVAAHQQHHFSDRQKVERLVLPRKEPQYTTQKRNIY